MSDGEAELYLREIAQFPLLDETEERELAVRVSGGDMEAREIMIRANLRLVVAIARRFASPALPFLDLVAEGNLGLLKAVERYRPEMGNRFSTYATWWIKQGVRRALTSKVKNVRVPAHMARLVARWRAMEKDLYQEFGRQPTQDEVAQRLGIPPERVEAVRQARGASYSSSFSGGGGGGSDDHPNENDIDEMLASRKDRDMDAMRAFANVEAEKLSVLLDCLPAREGEILRKRYALGDYDRPMTLDAIGQSFDPPITRERTRQLENHALQTLLRLLGNARQANE